MAQSTKLQIKTTGIDHVVLWVRDLERSRRFYMDLLGMTESHQLSDWQVFLLCGQNQVGLFEARDRVNVQASTELNHMALRMEPASYEETRERLEAEGIQVASRRDPPCIYFEDPDGHRLQLLYRGHDD